MDKIRIVYIIDRLEIGGTEKQLLELIHHLDRERFDPMLVCLKDAGSYGIAEIPCRQKILNVRKLKSLTGLLALLRFSCWLRNNHVDIVQTYFFDSTVFGVCSAKLARIKKIITCRRDLGFWYTPRLLRVLRFLNRFTDTILVNSRAIKSNVVEKEKCRPNKIRVIYNGINLAYFSPDPGAPQRIKTKYGIKEEKIVGTVANLNRGVKRVDLFIRAAALVCQSRNDASFVIVGDGHLKAELQDLAQALEVQDKVYFVGRQKNVLEWLHAFDIGVLASESEGFSNAILEYLACGLPVVCTDSGGNKEIIDNGKNGYRFENGNCQKLSKCILKILSFHHNGFNELNNKKAKKFSWDRIIQIYSGFYGSSRKCRVCNSEWNNCGPRNLRLL